MEKELTELERMKIADGVYFTSSGDKMFLVRNGEIIEEYSLGEIMEAYDLPSKKNMEKEDGIKISNN